MKNIHLLPTDKPSRLYINLLDYLSFDSLQLRGSNQNIYITSSDEEIKEGDWCIVTPFGADKFAKVIRFKKENGTLYNLDCNKITLTTDQDLIQDGVQAIDDEFLEWFVKNPSCEYVDLIGLRKEKGYEFLGYEIIIPKEEPKQETLEEVAHKMLDDYGIKSIGQSIGVLEVKKLMVKIAKWQAERSYSEEEVLEILRTFLYNLQMGEDVEDVKLWFEQYYNKTFNK